MTQSKPCPSCDGSMVYETRYDKVNYLNFSKSFRTTGWWCTSCSEAVFEGPELQAAERALDSLKADVRKTHGSIELELHKDKLELQTTLEAAKAETERLRALVHEWAGAAHPVVRGDSRPDTLRRRIGDLDRQAADAMATYRRLDAAERMIRGLAARVDRDGGQTQEGDPSLEATAARVDAAIAVLNNHSDQLNVLRLAPGELRETRRLTRELEELRTVLEQRDPWVEAALKDYDFLATLLRDHGVQYWDDTTTAIGELIVYLGKQSAHALGRLAAKVRLSAETYRTCYTALLDSMLGAQEKGDAVLTKKLHAALLELQHVYEENRHEPASTERLPHGG